MFYFYRHTAGDSRTMSTVHFSFNCIIIYYSFIQISIFGIFKCAQIFGKEWVFVDKKHFSNGSIQIEVIENMTLMCILKNCINQNFNKYIVELGEHRSTFGVLPHNNLKVYIYRRYHRNNFYHLFAIKKSTEPRKITIFISTFYT